MMMTSPLVVTVGHVTTMSSGQAIDLGGELNAVRSDPGAVRENISRDLGLSVEDRV